MTDLLARCATARAGIAHIVDFHVSNSLRYRLSVLERSIKWGDAGSALVEKRVARIERDLAFHRSF
jgi:hypothetical protein